MSAHVLRALVSSLLLAVVTACTTSTPSTDAALPLDTHACSPDVAGFDTNVEPLVARYCGTCHDTTPNFGAPVSLLDGASLLARRPDGTTLAQRMAARLVDGSMPPVGMPRLPQADANSIVQWASCGALSAPASTGLVSSAAPLIAPTTGPSGLTPLDFTAGGFAVGPEVRDEYRCFVFDADIPEDRFVRRFEMIFGETRVLHHVILSRDTEHRTTPGSFDCIDGSGVPIGSEYLYVWAPGQAALEFPSGGLRVSPGQRFVLQIHYNNGTSLPDVRDESGVRMLLGPVEGPEYGMFALGSQNFSLPPRTRTAVASRCTLPGDTTLLAGMPHMHRLGSEFEETIVRAGATGSEPLVHLTGWEFSTQLFYRLPVSLHAGDVITTTCTYENPSADAVPFGPGTAQEMCDDFVYATPPPTELLCDEGNPDRPTDVAYVPGACLPSGTSTDAPLVRGGWTMAAMPPPLASGPVADGRYVLESLDLYATGGATPIGDIDFANAYMLGRGQVVIAAGALSYDVSFDNVVLFTTGTRFGMPDHQGFTVPFDGASGHVSVPATCPAGGAATAFDWGASGDLLTIQFTKMDIPGQTLWPAFRFRRAP